MERAPDTAACSSRMCRRRDMRAVGSLSLFAYGTQLCDAPVKIPLTRDNRAMRDQIGGRAETGIERASPNPNPTTRPPQLAAETYDRMRIGFSAPFLSIGVSFACWAVAIFIFCSFRVVPNASDLPGSFKERQAKF